MEENYPELKTRVQSTFIDTMLMLGLMFLVATILDKVNPSQNNEDGWIRGVIFIAIWGVYEPLSLSIGCTLGNYLMKIRVRSYANSTKRINVFQAFVRYVVKIALGWISFLTISSNKKRRAIHDFVGGSVMISK